MKKFSILLVLTFLVCLIPSCHFYREQIDELYAEVDSLKLSDSNLRLRLDQLNSSLTTLKELVSSMQSGLYIKSVVTLTGDTEQSGYLITMSNGVTYTIRNGRDGQDGQTPRLGVKLGQDGAYYWTLDGEFLTDESGSQVRADGATPLFDIRDGYWYLSLDGGAHWENLGRATGEDGLPGAPGDQIFQSVDYTPGENVVRFVLSDGTSIMLPCYQPIAISFNIPENQTSINSGETIKVDYSLSYGDGNTVVTASSDGNYVVKVEARDAVSGSILITCPGLYLDGHVSVMAFDGVGYATVAVITFYEKKMSFGSSLSFTVPTEGDIIRIPVSYNFGYILEPVGNAADWITVIRTRADMEAGVIELEVAPNDGEPRTGKVRLVPENSVSGPFAVITVTQEGAFFEIGESNFVFGSSGGNAHVNIWTSKQFTVSVPSEASSWVSLETVPEEDGGYRVDITVNGNQTSEKRSVSIPVTDSVSGQALGTIEIIQLTGSGASEMDMVFEVRANESNDYTVYLPVNGNDGNACTVDWGDGTFTRVDASMPDKDEPVSHVYQDITGTGATFRVTLSDTLRRLNSILIPEGLRSGIVSVIQWGHTGLTDMSDAFNGSTGLVSLPADETLAFGEVSSFHGAFSNCPRLEQISPRLFAAAGKVQDFGAVFSNCESLQVIPESLFSACESAESYESAFNACRNLEVLPSRLFEGSHALSFNNVFDGCSRLSQVPEDLFKDCSSVRSVSSAFRSCRSLEEIPGGLFAGCPELTDVSSVFESCALQAIPAGLFGANPKLERMDAAFRNCTKLTSIPGNLFDACTSISSVEGLFRECSGLKTVPVEIFDNQRKIANFHRCFMDCKELEGESPYTLVGGQKVHLYERSAYPDYFVMPAYHDDVFSECVNLDDFDSIPVDWK